MIYNANKREKQVIKKARSINNLGNNKYCPNRLHYEHDTFTHVVKYTRALFNEVVG